MQHGFARIPAGLFHFLDFVLQFVHHTSQVEKEEKVENGWRMRSTQSSQYSVARPKSWSRRDCFFSLFSFPFSPFFLSTLLLFPSCASSVVTYLHSKAKRMALVRNHVDGGGMTATSIGECFADPPRFRATKKRSQAVCPLASSHPRILASSYNTGNHWPQRRGTQ
jgi:hypothetical protein